MPRRTESNQYQKESTIMSTDKKRKSPATAKQYREAAKRLHQEDGECEIDANAKISRASTEDEEGAYVQAWVWVPRQAVDKEYDPDGTPASWQCNGCNRADRLA